MYRSFQHISALSHFRNPWALAFDKLHWVHSPYSVNTWNGTTIEIRPQTSDRYTAFEMLGLGVYAWGLDKIRRGDIVVDVGANIGCFATEAARIVGASGLVIAVEPEEQTYDRLLRNVQLNRLSQVVTTRNAIGGRSGIVNLRVPERTPLFASVFNEVDGRNIAGESQSVSCLTLAELMKRHKTDSVHLLKLDCEGAEHDIIATLEPQLAQNIENMIIEFHRVPGIEISNSIRHLKDLGYNHTYHYNHIFSRQHPASRI